MNAMQEARNIDAILQNSTAGYFVRLYACFYTICALATLWVFFLARPFRPGLMRALMCLPVVILQLLATPYLVDRERTAVLVVPTMGILSLSAFKVAAYAFGRGPLALPLPWLNQLTKFGAVLSMPVIPRAAFKVSQGTSPEALGSIAPSTPATFLYCYAWKATGALFAAVMSVSPYLPELARHWFYALCLSLSLGSIWDFWCLMAVLCFNIEVAPSFDKPWLSSSFSDYWARRWNLTTTYMLRVLIYEPVMEQSLVPKAVASAEASQAMLGMPNGKPAQSLHLEAAVADKAAAAAPAGSEDEAEQPPSPPSSTSSSNTCLPNCAENTCATAAAAAETSDRERQKVSVSISSSSSSGSIADNAGTGNSGVSSAAAINSPEEAAVTQPLSRKQKMLRRMLAVHATFLFSGLWHMLIFYYATGLLTYHWLAFFTVQAPILTLEAILIKWCKAKQLMLPRPAAIFLTNFLLIVVANPLFFGPCDWSGLCTAMYDNISGRQSSSS